MCLGIVETGRSVPLDQAFSGCPQPRIHPQARVIAQVTPLEVSIVCATLPLVYGIRTRRQLLDAGVSTSTIARRCQSGAYERLLPEIYATDPPSMLARCYAVTLWLPMATLSHRTAAWLHNWSDAPTVVEATVPPDKRVRPPRWLRIYRSDLPGESISDAWDLPVTTAPQTLVDCIAVLPRTAADALVDQVLPAIGSDAVLRTTARAQRRGNKGACQQLRLAAIGAASEPERQLGREFNSRHFRLAVNAPVGPYFGDFVDYLGKVVVEVDGREFHSTPEVFRRDRHRQNWMVRHGWLVLRYSAFDVLRDPGAVADEVIEVVRRRRRSRRRRG